LLGKAGNGSKTACFCPKYASFYGENAQNSATKPNKQQRKTTIYAALQLGEMQLFGR
tara:strand:+ start:1882 stop:2052 length:171 start_codon:yes stop_codon:yes gene_type:complete